MTKASDNVYPRLLISEGGSTATPAAGRVTVYAKSDGLMYSKDDAGAETALGGAAGTLPTAHGCRVKRSSGNFSIGNNVMTAVEFNAEDFDTDTMHDNSTNPTRVTIPTISGVTTGLWSITAGGYIDVSTPRCDVLIKKNAAGNPASGTPLAFATFSSSSINGYVIATQAVLSATDYVECFVRSTAGSGNVMYDADVSPIFSVAFLGKVT
jgi:hypothetical protein